MLAIDLLKCTNSLQLFWCLTPHVFPLYPHCGRANHPALREFRSGAFQLNPPFVDDLVIPMVQKRLNRGGEEMCTAGIWMYLFVIWGFSGINIKCYFLAISCYLLYLYWDRERFFLGISRAGALGHVVHFVMLWAARAVALDTNGCHTYGDPFETSYQWKSLPYGHHLKSGLGHMRIFPDFVWFLFGSSLRRLTLWPAYRHGPPRLEDCLVAAEAAKSALTFVVVVCASRLQLVGKTCTL